MNTATPFRTLGEFLAELFPYKVQKISLDAGFTCPNRDGTKGRSGCTYCNNVTFVPDYCRETTDVGEQMERGIRFFAHKYPSMRYLAYFQSYTNTYGDTASLMALYERALAHPEVVGLVIATRPDCVSEELLEALGHLAGRCFVMLEFGIESTLDRTLIRIGRGHSFAETEQAIRAAHRRGIRVGGHLILGLPGETTEEMMAHAAVLSTLPIATLKLHQLQIVSGAQMEHQYRDAAQMFHLFSEEEYLSVCIEFTRRLRPSIVVERFTAETPPELLIAPRWGTKNFRFAQKVIRRMQEQGFRQGDLYRGESSEVERGIAGRAWR